MKVTPITSPLPGEHLAATWPVMRVDPNDSRPRSNPGWRQRLRFWAGRALTEDALALDQENRAARLAWIGRMMTGGIVHGLEVALEPPPGPLELQLLDLPDPAAIPDSGRMLAIVARASSVLHFRVFDDEGQRIVTASGPEITGREDELTRLGQAISDHAGSSDPLEETQRRAIIADLSSILGHRVASVGHHVHLLPGHGITAFGDDVSAPRPLRVALDEIPAPGLVAGVEPWAAIVLLRPAEFRRFDNIDPNDPCELDPSYDAFADERRQDASLLELHALPESIRTLPELADPDLPAWRNRLVYALFSLEAAGAPHQLLRRQEIPRPDRRWDAPLHGAAVQPWETLGLPLALLGSELAPGEARRTLFLDRAAVARPGGRSRPRSRPGITLATESVEPPGAGVPALWRARVDQFAEQLGALDESTPIATRAQQFRFVPPAGLLPRPALELLTTSEAVTLDASDRAAVSRFFPEALAVEAAPIPSEDLDAALGASASLAPFDLGSEAPEAVRVLVPVPQRVFDPALLVVEAEDPLFAREIGRLVAERQDWRQRRDYLQAHRDTLQTKLLGERPAAVVPRLERGQLEPEPVETAASLGFTAALLSPVNTRPPWELEVVFDGRRTVTEDTSLFVHVRLEHDRPVGPIEIRWRRDAAEFLARFDTPPSYPLEPIRADGQPLATPLWLSFTSTARDIGVTDGELTGFSLRIFQGRVAVSRAGEVLPDASLDAWWTASADIGDWTSIPETGRAIDPEDDPPPADQLLAPFEALPRPAFDDDKTMRERLDELDLALNPADATPRTVPLTLATAGVEKVLAELSAEASESDDFVDANFVRAQTNLYRVRKLVLGETAAQQLLINPAIATIAEQETANATAEKFGAYIAAAKQKTVDKVDLRQALTGGKRTNGDVGPTPGPAAPAAAIRAVGRGDVFLPIKPNPSIPGASGGGISLFPGDGAKDPKIVIEPPSRSITGKQDILGQLPLAGPTLPPRGLSIGQRFIEPKATETIGFARSALVQLLDQLPKLRLPLVNESVRPVDRSATPTPVRLLDLQGRSLSRDDKTTETLRTEARDALLKVGEIPDKDASGNDIRIDEAEVTLASLDMTETKSAILRTIERVIQDRRAVIERGRETVAAVRTALALSENRLTALAPRLAEARHDVSVARALRQEEQARVAEINERRDTIIRDEVRFLAYVRPRAVDLVRRSLPAWRLELNDAPAPVPACLANHDEPPDALRAFVHLFRHSPARWFVDIAPKLRELNTNEKLNELLAITRQSALQFVGAKQLPFLRADLQAAPLAAILSGFSIIEALRSNAARVAPANGKSVSWNDQRRVAEQHSSMGDVIDGRHGHSSLSRAAADVLERIEDVATCLHAEFAGVAPAIRLAWVERYSVFDRPSPLNDLTALPHYGSLPREARRRFQAFVDWLFGQIDRGERDAFNLFNDLVRICLLLASHAPVKQLITGHVPKPVAVRPGVRIPIKPVNPNLVRVGMEVHVWQASTNTIVARGLVEDLKDGEVSARMDKVLTSTSTTTIDQTMRVQFVAPAFGMSVKGIGLK